MTTKLDLINPADRLTAMERVTAEGLLSLSKETVRGNEYYVFGQYFNKGGWHTPDIIKTGPDGIEMDKLKINYVNADGFEFFNEVEYDSEVYYLEEDSTGKSSSFYVNQGNNLMQCIKTISNSDQINFEEFIFDGNSNNNLDKVMKSFLN